MKGEIELKLRKYRKEFVFILDLLIILIVSTTLFYVLPDNNGNHNDDYLLFLPHLILLIICGAILQYFFKTYDSLWRYAESKEYLMLILGGITGYSSFYLIDYCLFDSPISISFSIAASSLSLLAMLLMRLSYRQYRKCKKNRRNQNCINRIPLAIIGAGEAGVKLQEEIANNPNSRYNTIYFIDDSIEKIGKVIHNIEVKGPIIKLDQILSNTPVREIIVAMPSITSERRRAIVEICSSMKCHVQILPDTLSLLQNEEDDNNIWKKVREIRIEELLGREQIVLDNEEVEKFLFNKVVMVTGGGGSIGSELCRQIAKVSPKRLVIIDIYENSAYDIQQELHQIYGKLLEVKIEIASIRDKEKINKLFEHHRPNIVFHAAAHKHVPLMEDCPEEAIKNNIFGTYNVVQASDTYGVEKFVLVSTDKAVNPTSIMGASKRFCEMILQSMKEVSKTEFVAVRFGNVLGSNGSVIPLFQKQIARGGPVTITDKRIVRYFMTISEAVQLVLQAGSMANSAEIYVLDMGQPVKILDLAENLIRLSGHEPYTEIEIVETGLRPGEKLYEELLMDREELIATANHKIFIERQINISQNDLKIKSDILQKSLDSGSFICMKRALKFAVPTYRDPEEMNIGNNSIRLEDAKKVSTLEELGYSFEIGI
jgi:FlaA1/EpsC-like NDP-sugar epimerase